MENKHRGVSIHSGHRKRVRENVCKNGFSAMEDHQFLELILFYAIPQADTNELAHNLLNEFGSLNEVFSGSIERLKKVKGVGDSVAVLLSSFGEAHKRVSKADLSKKRVYKTPDDFKLLAKNSLLNETVETVVMFCFDSKGRLLKEVLISKGTRSSSGIDFRNAVSNALQCEATKAVICHNHPEGSSCPSAQDIDSTRNLCVMLRRLGVYLVDHIVVGCEDKSAYSMYDDQDLRGMFY